MTIYYTSKLPTQRVINKGRDQICSIIPYKYRCQKGSERDAEKRGREADDNVPNGFLDRRRGDGFRQQRWVWQ